MLQMLHHNSSPKETLHRATVGEKFQLAFFRGTVNKRWTQGVIYSDDS